jgi:predicted  nucleic acid-binding Zn-ribbon protein
MTDTGSALKELQRLDQAIATHEATIAAFDPRIEEIEGPVLRLETEAEGLQRRLKEIRVEERRVELAADSKRDRSLKLQERLNAVRNVREEAAVHAEMDMVRRAIEGEETEALTLLEQIRKMEERLSEQESALEEARAVFGPEMKTLLTERESAAAGLDGLVAERDGYASGISEQERRLYERIMSGSGRSVAVADLTGDGACGYCYCMVPLQTQSEIRVSNLLIRCEACGVILTPPSPEPEVIPAQGLDTGSTEDAAPAAEAGEDEEE